ncbi:Flagellar hook-basal body complex protein FliE [Defluviimonas aquaemixtae]|uniref:Flagellar hook-basal body complex protein FliE n=1 Tax=Albidovulum aquaemixtae TaxID=1542388 RepID=A0A2R8BJ68_9RHOB|nr:flagellar hook-basal body complex protein FliE [Defluviimonas aquaemixtae]SPH23446.1 Flagellar hook-basal body complex protein FliE [Defluviimonas aquaemixtae]
MDVRTSFAAQGYTQARPATQPSPNAAGSAGAAQGFAALAENFAETLRAGEETAKAAMMGGADPHALVEALAASELAVETAVTLRNKVVEAYQEILRMPV